MNDEAVYAVLLHGERVGSLRFFDSWSDARSDTPEDVARWIDEHAVQTRSRLLGRFA